MKNNKIYSDCYQATITIFGRTKTFPRALRPTLGRQSEEAILQCLLSIRKANTSTLQDQLNHLYQASNALDDLRTLINLSKDMHALNCNGHGEIVTLTKEIGKELGGFIKYAKKRVTA